MISVRPPTRWTAPIRPGQRIRVTQVVVVGDQEWTTQVEGVVESCEPEVTGSWYAHGKNDKLWLIRIRLIKANGEVAALVVDRNSRIEVLPPAGATGRHVTGSASPAIATRG